MYKLFIKTLLNVADNSCEYIIHPIPPPDAFAGLDAGIIVPGAHFVQVHNVDSNPDQLPDNIPKKREIGLSF